MVVGVNWGLFVVGEFVKEIWQWWGWLGEPPRGINSAAGTTIGRLNPLVIAMWR